MLLALLPMAIAMIGERPAPRAWLVETGAMLGLLGLGVLAMQLVITGRHPRFAGSVGQDNLLQFHLSTGVFGWLLVLAHPLLLMAGDPDFLAWLDPREGLLRAVTMAGLLAAITVQSVTSLWRVQLGLQYETWRSVQKTLWMSATFLRIIASLRRSGQVFGRPQNSWSNTMGTSTWLRLTCLVPVFALSPRRHRPLSLTG